MQFECPKCSRIVSTDEANLGKPVACGHCGETVNVPSGRFDKGVIINDFMIEKELGVGGMGIVYLARQITLDRLVALKILKENYTNNAEFIVQFVREARAAAKLNHPNIVQAYAVGEENGIFFFAMEFVDGETMKEVLAKEKKIQPQRAAKIIFEIAGALDYAWTENKIVHHDIKPDNIMLTKNGKAKLADLGLASIFGDASIDNEDDDEVLGTPQYISPEQLLGEPTDVRSDIYSLGATFYHLVTGQFPYNGATTTEIAHQHVNGTFVPPIEVEKSLPTEINDIIAKMMAKDINMRYQTADELVRDLRYYMDMASGNIISTASVPITPVVENKPPKVEPPAGGLKLSFGAGAKFPPAPAKTKSDSAAQSTTPPTTAAAKTPAPAAHASPPKITAPGKTPAVSAPGSSVNVPKVNLSGSKTSSVAAPKINLGGNKTPAAAPSVSVPKITKPSPVAAPSLGLKKEEPPKAAPVAAKPAEAAAKPEENTPPQAVTTKKGKKKSAEKGKKDDSDKKKKTDAPEKKIPVGLIFLVVILLLIGGGITYYLYRNNWKAPIIDDIKAWNAKRKEIAKNTVRRIPAPPPKELTIEEIRKDYIPKIEKLKKFIADNPSAGKEFLQKTKDFISEEGTPQLDKEKAPFNELTELFNEYDEKVYAVPARAKAAAAHKSAISTRQQIEKAAIEAKKRREAEARAAREEQKRREAEAAKRRQEEAEAKRLAEEKLNKFKARIAPSYNELAKLFYEAILSDEKMDELNNYTNRLFSELSPSGIEMEVFNKVEAFANKLKAELPEVRKYYRYMTENTKRFTGHILMIPRQGQVEITSFSFKNHEVAVRSVISQRKRKISLKDSANFNRFIDLLKRRLPKEKKYIEKYPFYYQLFFGDMSKAESLKPSSEVWRDFFKYYR